MSVAPTVLLESYGRGPAAASYLFDGYCEPVVARRPEAVVPALERIERALAEGLHAAGFVSYEAASGLDAALTTAPADEFPLLWFGLFERRQAVSPGQLAATGAYQLSTWQASLPSRQYERALEQIGRYIVAGDTYQVNFTMRLAANFSGDERAFYRDLCQAQRTCYSAYIDLGRYCVLSASPELFFEVDNGTIATRPMKGTWRRGRWLEEDEAMAEALRTSAKDRAENAMIVDLLRNDLGRLAQPGTVRVPRLWDIERYETLWQMTSTVKSRLRPAVGLVDLFKALFPCGSVTGAPKVRTMEIIRQLETTPRHLYTGAIGFLSPGLQARFNVAIRTVCIDRQQGSAEFGVGGGITHYSSAAAEYEECMLKAQVLSAVRADFELLETMRWTAADGFFLLGRHLRRLRRSARYFGYPYKLGQVRRALERGVADLGDGPWRLRLLLNARGQVRVTSAPLSESAAKSMLKVGIAREPVDSRDPLLYHKTTQRGIYERRRAAHPDCDEVLLVNERGEVTECTIGNIVAELPDGQWTPPRQCGLLAGTFRQELLDRGQIGERVLSVAQVRTARRLFMINSVRRWVPLKLH